MYSSIIVSLFTELCNHDHNLILECSHHPQRNFELIYSYSSFLDPAPGNNSATFCPYWFAFTGHCPRVESYNKTDTFQLTYCFWGSSMLLHVSVLYLNFLPLIILHNTFKYKWRTGAFNEQRMHLLKSTSIVAASRFCMSCSSRWKSKVNANDSITHSLFLLLGKFVIKLISDMLL